MSSDLIRYRHSQRRLRLGACAMAALACAACAPMPPPPPPPPPPAPVVIEVPTMAPEDLAARQLLAWQAAIAKMNGADLTKEAARLADNPATLVDTMKAALALSYTHNPGDLGRAQGLLERVLNNGTTEAQAWHGLAHLLSTAFADQRRAEEQIERLNQQLRDTQRDNQRKLDQLSEKLEALKSIERSLTNRAPTAPGPFFSTPSAPPSTSSSPIIKPPVKP